MPRPACARARAEGGGRSSVRSRRARESPRGGSRDSARERLREPARRGGRRQRGVRARRRSLPARARASAREARRHPSLANDEHAGARVVRAGDDLPHACLELGPAGRDARKPRLAQTGEGRSSRSSSTSMGGLYHLGERLSADRSVRSARRAETTADSCDRTSGSDRACPLAPRPRGAARPVPPPPARALRRARW